MVLTPCARARSAISRASASVAPRGHSVKTCFPARRAAIVSSWWKGTRTATATTSMSGWLTISR